MKVVIFEPGYDAGHRQVLRAFADGIPGAVVRPVEQFEPCDVGVIFGGVSKRFKHTWSKQKVMDRAGRFIMIESAFIQRGRYHQIGWGGAAGHADFNTGPDTPLDRWETIIHTTKCHPWQSRPNGPVVVCGQLPRDVQVQDVDHVGWCRKTVDHFQRQGVNVWFRPHPKVNNIADYGVPSKFIDTRPLAEVLDVARCFVTWNSTSGTDAAVAGVPVVAMDRGSMAWPVAAHQLDDLSHMPDRSEWFAGLGYSQWTIEEMREGKPWRHLMGQ